jgi:cytochrome c2
MAAMKLGTTAPKGGLKMGRTRRRYRAAAGLLLAFALAMVLPSNAGATDEITYFRTDTPEFKASAKFGKQMFEAYQCALCHATREGQALTNDIIAPNLILSKERLRPEWILDWLIDPQALQPGTKMPNFFSFNEDDDYNPIYGDADAHVQYRIIVALRDYLMVLGTDEEPQLDQP